MVSFFGRLRKTSPNSPVSPEVTPAPVQISITPTVRLRVALDPLPNRHQDLFYIHVNPDSDVSAIRRAVSERIGDVGMGIFKASVPWQAHYQAEAYTERYCTPVNLVSTFPSFCLDDPEQLPASLGPAGWGLPQLERSLTIRDWFPEAISLESDTISVLVRTAQGSSSKIIPITLLSHIATVNHRQSPRDSPRINTVGGPSSAPNTAPIPIDIDPNSTINELKAAIVKADGRGDTRLDRVVLWRVEMSKEEMVVIDQRGGLKGGQMPWPYPPTAPVPVQLSDGNLPISHYFPKPHSNCRIVNVSAWIHPSQPSKTIPEKAIGAPPFQYPMVVSRHLGENERSRISISASPPSAQGVWTPLTLDLNRTLAPVGKKSSRGRPSTAPAVIVNLSGGAPKVHTFGSKSMLPRTNSASPGNGNSHGTGRVISPLATNQPRGLGINVIQHQSLPTDNDDHNHDKHHDGGVIHDKETMPSLSTSPNASDDDDSSVPNHLMSNLSLKSDHHLLRTPDAERNQHWMPPDEQRELKKTASLRVTIGGERRSGLVTEIFKR